MAMITGEQRSAIHNGRAAVFLDKDGTLIEDIPYNADPDRIHLVPGALQALQRLNWAGYRLIVISNQPGVAHGFFSEEQLAAVEERIRSLLTAGDVPLAGFYYCPHHPHATVTRYAIRCGCRKPAPGLIHQALLDHGLIPQQCWMVGDILNDIEAGRHAGCRTVLVDNGHETEWHRTPERTPHYTVPTLLHAAEAILGAPFVSPSDHPGSFAIPTSASPLRFGGAGARS
jgi:histidinol-phosphate phosphatase family protein